MLFITTVFVSGVLQYLSKTRLYYGALRSLYRDRLLYQSASSSEDVSATDDLQMLLMHIRKFSIIIIRTFSMLSSFQLIIICFGLDDSGA